MSEKTSMKQKTLQKVVKNYLIDEFKITEIKPNIVIVKTGELGDVYGSFYAINNNLYFSKVAFEVGVLAEDEDKITLGEIEIHEMVHCKQLNDLIKNMGQLQLKT